MRKDRLPSAPGPLGAGPWRWPRRPALRVWVWTAATVAIVVAWALLWVNSDAAATTSTTTPRPAAPHGTPAASLSRAWSAAGDPVPRAVVQDDRVILGSAHRVEGLDVSTGRPAWRYLRSNAHLCGLTAVDGIAVAVFRTADRCDEAVALDAGTGVRRWTRNIDLRPDAVLAGTTGIVLASSPTGIVTLDPAGDNIRWRYHAPGGCRLLASAAGTGGVAVLQRCPGSSQVQLKLFDGFNGTPHWSRDLPLPDGVPTGTVPRLVGADRVLGVVFGDRLQLLAATDGSLVGTLPAGGQASPAQTEVGDVALFWAAGKLTAIDVATHATLWQRPALGLPAVSRAGNSLAGSTSVVVPEESGFARLDLRTGTEKGRWSVSGLSPGGSATPVGPVVVYRLPGHVLGYR